MLRGENLCNSFGFLCCRELSALSWTISKSGLGYILTQFVFHFCCSLTFLFPALRIHNLQNKIFYYGKIKYLIKDIKDKTLICFIHVHTGTTFYQFRDEEYLSNYRTFAHQFTRELVTTTCINTKSVPRQNLLKCSYFMSMFFPMQFLIVIHLYSSFELNPLPLLYLFYTIYLAITFINLA